MIRSSKEWLLRVARATGLFRWMRRRHRHELLVLTYHSVVRDVRKHRRRHPLVYRTAVDADRFERQIRYLQRHYRPLDGADLRAVLEGASPPERAVVVTFDDGLLNNNTVALPILHRLQMPAVFFLPTGFLDAASERQLRRHWTEGLIARLSLQVERDAFDSAALDAHLTDLDTDLTARSSSEAILRVVDHLKTLPRPQRTDRLATLQADLGDPPQPSAFPADPEGHSILATMTWDDARTAANHGITLGGHTINHESLARLPDEAAATEIEDSLGAIADRTDQPGDLFSYPYGRVRDFTDRHQTILTEAGCRGAFTQITGFNDATTDPLALHRIDVSPNYDLGMFAYVVSGTKHAVDRLVRRR
jgi:peptidoglycan/xylan/chitin deacetylase (PgdA/CDA1 family)